MKKHFIAAVSLAVAASGILASCGNKNQTETATVEETTVEETVTPAETTTTQDSLKAIDQMVEAVTASVNGINGTKYDAAFFNNVANKGEKASADQYAQTPSGLKYVIASEGTGKSPKASDTVTVHYVGTLTNGSQFDSSIDRGEPTSFPLNRVIPGWTEGLQLMKEGGTAVFFIPAELAYGNRDLPGIPAGSTLMFWVQLIQVD